MRVFAITVRSVPTAAAGAIVWEIRALEIEAECNSEGPTGFVLWFCFDMVGGKQIH